MMIEFTDSFSQACVAEACAAFPDLRKRLMVELVLPMFVRPLNDVGQEIGKPIIKSNPIQHYIKQCCLFHAEIWLSTFPKRSVSAASSVLVMNTDSLHKNGNALSMGSITTMATINNQTGVFTLSP